MRPSIHQAPPGPTSPSWAQWRIRCQGHPETPSLRRRWDDENKKRHAAWIFVTKTFSIYQIIIYIYIYHMLIVWYYILQYITITIYKVLVQSLALASMVSMAVASAPTTGSLRGQARHWMVVPEIQIWMEWIQEWIFICYPLVNVYITMENHHF